MALRGGMSTKYNGLASEFSSKEEDLISCTTSNYNEKNYFQQWSPPPIWYHLIQQKAHFLQSEGFLLPFVWMYRQLEDFLAPFRRVCHLDQKASIGQSGDFHHSRRLRSDNGHFLCTISVFIVKKGIFASCLKVPSLERTFFYIILRFHFNECPIDPIHLKTRSA